MSSDASLARSARPAVDDRLVEPETRYEMVDGELVHVSPADRPHGSRHLQLCALIEAYTGLEIEAACDQLTRTSESDDIAPDVSVYPEAPDPATGGRQLEELAFEVVSTQSLSNAAGKAAKLVGRGVRRVFAIDIARSRALEWQSVPGAWSELDPTGSIEDPALAAPLPIAALIHNAKADDAVARALILKHNAVIEAHTAGARVEAKAEGRVEGRVEGRIEGRAEGRVEGKREAVITLLASRGLSLDGAARDRIFTEHDPQRLDRWIVRAPHCATLADLFDES